MGPTSQVQEYMREAIRAFLLQKHSLYSAWTQDQVVLLYASEVYIQMRMYLTDLKESLSPTNHLLDTSESAVYT